MTSSTSRTSPFSVTSSGGKLELKIGKIFSNISFFHKNDLWPCLFVMKQTLPMSTRVPGFRFIACFIRKLGSKIYQKIVKNWKKNYLKNTYYSSFSCAPSMSSYDFPLPS